MNILAVADQESQVLLSWIEKQLPELKKIDLILSAGDLSYPYLEYLSVALGRDVFFVRGNHDHREIWNADGETFPDSVFSVPIYTEKNNSLINIHCKIKKFGSWLVLGLEGSLWYNGQGTQYSESRMRRMVETVVLRSRVQRILEKFLGQPRQWIVLTHAPMNGIHDQRDLCHRGFESFYEILRVLNPTIWIHGHTATRSLADNQLSRWGTSTILNAYEYKFIHLSPGKGPEISFNPSVLLL